MPLTPVDVHNVAFKKPPIGKRGYDEEEVDAFLDEVERELGRLLEDNRQLRTHIGGRPAPLGGGEQVPSVADVEEVRARLDRLLMAKANAEREATELREAVERAVADRSRVGPPTSAGEPADQGLRVLMMAQRTADEHVGDARREAEKILGEARAHAQEVHDSARAKADAVESAARQRHQEVIAGLDAKRGELLSYLQRLTGMERDYRNGLRAHAAQRVPELGNLVMPPEPRPF